MGQQQLDGLTDAVLIAMIIALQDIVIGAIQDLRAKISRREDPALRKRLQGGKQTVLQAIGLVAGLVCLNCRRHQEARQCPQEGYAQGQRANIGNAGRAARLTGAVDICDPQAQRNDREKVAEYVEARLVEGHRHCRDEQRHKQEIRAHPLAAIQAVKAEPQRENRDAKAKSKLRDKV